MDPLLLEKNATSNSYQITPISHAHLILKHQQQQYVSIIVTGSRKRGPFPQKSDCMLDPSADSVKCILHACENSLILILVHCDPKVTVLEFYTHAYLGFEISTFISILWQNAWSLRIYMCTMFGGYYSVTGQLPMATVSHLVVFVNV